MKIKKAVPFSFALELLESLEPVTRAMFGCTAVYVGEKIVLVLRDQKKHPDDNGVWLATVPEHHESLKTEFPSLRRIALLAGGGPTAWQNLPVDAPDFEESVERACRLILKGDPRIGKIPERRGKTPKKNSKSGTRKSSRGD